MVDLNSTAEPDTRAVGVTTGDYPSKRNFLGDVIPGFVFVPVNNAFDYVLKGLRYSGAVRLGLAQNHCDAWSRTLHYPLPGRRVDLYHFWNTLSFGRTPWVVSAESFLPRWNPRSKQGVKLMAGEACRRIIPISENSRKMILTHLDASPSCRERIISKMTVLQPPQRVLLAELGTKNWTSGPLRLAFVGHEFYRKGGYECVLAVSKLLERQVDLHLTVVSSMSPSIYGSTVEEEISRETAKLMARHADRIECIPSMPHAEVERLFLQSHVALLPTYVDTYGYSVLEAQAAGCPVISTDVRALPEINNDSCGWMLQVPKDEFGNAFFATPDEKNKLRRHLSSSLEGVLERICSNREELPRKAAASLQRIASEHDPAMHAMALRHIYQTALGLEPFEP